MYKQKLNFYVVCFQCISWTLCLNVCFRAYGALRLCSDRISPNIYICFFVNIHWRWNVFVELSVCMRVLWELPCDASRKSPTGCRLISSCGRKTNLSKFYLSSFTSQEHKNNSLYFFSSLSCRVLMYSIASSITWDESKIIGVIISRRSDGNKITINV